MTAACDLDRAGLVDGEISRIATQYRESPHLIGLISAYVGQVADVIGAACPIPDAFDIDDAVGDQLTIIGKWLGWPRVHCRGARQAVFGFASESCNPCDPSTYMIGGFCSDWGGCPASEFASYEFVDDELYRRFLKARVVQLSRDYRRPSLVASAQALFDAEDATIFAETPGRVSISLARASEPGEWQILDLYRQVLPIAPGIKVAFRTQYAAGSPFGLGDGWGGFCAPWSIPIEGEEGSACFIAFGDESVGFCAPEATSIPTGLEFPEAPVVDGAPTVSVDFVADAITGTGLPGATVVLDFNA